MMTPPDSNSLPMSGGCMCGEVRYAISGPLLFRAHCHCETCQAYTQAEHADIIVMRSRDVILEGESQIGFRFHQFPPVINRGTCAACGGVAVERIHLPVSPKLTIIPAQTLESTDGAPNVAFHMFYHRRVKDAQDRLPKHSGYLRSQTAFSMAALRSLRKT